MAVTIGKTKNDLHSNLAKQRMRLYNWLRRCLLGPDLGADIENDTFDLKGINPLDRYYVGILYPVVRGESGTDPATKETENQDGSPIDKTAENEEKNTAKPTSPKYRYVPPSSVGFSFFIRGAEIRLQVSPRASKYELNSDRNQETGQFLRNVWSRTSLSDDALSLPDFQPPDEKVEYSIIKRIFDDCAEIMVI